MPPRRARPLRAYAVIMAGGLGTRFWPQSRRRLPKQFLTIAGRRSLLQATMDRLAGLVATKRILVVAPRPLVPLIRRQLPRLPAANLLVEPAARGTAACIALAAACVARRDPSAVIGVFPADHVIDDRRRFQEALRRGIEVADRDRRLVTFGVKPDRPETGYGYIRLGRAFLGGRPRVLRVRGFREKPDGATARRYVAAGYLWNAGIFVWRVDVLDEAFALHAPEVAAVMAAIRAHGIAGRGVERRYRRLAPVPVDRAILERAENVAVVEATFGWNDVGSWAALADVWGKDERGNARRGPSLVVDASDTVLFARDRLIAVVGVEDLVVVDSLDAILVCRKSRSQDVRRLVEALGHTRYRGLL